jgi:hypothetical protein
MLAETTSAASIVPSSTTRTGIDSGSSQFVIQVTYIQACHIATSSRPTRNAPCQERSSSSNWENWVIAKT